MVVIVTDRLLIGENFIAMKKECTSHWQPQHTLKTQKGDPKKTGTLCFVRFNIVKY